MRRKFYIPLGMPVFSAHPPAPNEAGDTYYNSALKKVLTYDGTQWVTSGGSGDLLAGNGMFDEIRGELRALHVGQGPGVKVTTDLVSLDLSYTDNRYVNADGDTMTGQLAVPTPPVNFNHASSKKYVDDTVAGLAARNVVAGAGLSGGGQVSTNPTLNVGGGWGITVNADNIEANQGTLDGRYSLTGHAHNYSAPHDHPYASNTHSHSPQQLGIYAAGYNFGTVNAGATKTSPAIGKAGNDYIFVQNVHTSTYLFFTVVNVTVSSFQIECRNSTSSTDHTNVNCWYLRVPQ